MSPPEVTEEGLAAFLESVQAELQQMSQAQAVWLQEIADHDRMREQAQDEAHEADAAARAAEQAQDAQAILLHRQYLEHRRAEAS